MFENTAILLLHTAAIGGLTLFFLRLGREAMVAWLAILATCSNLFVIKQVRLFSLEVTCSDALAVGYLLGLNLIQEFFGQKSARKAVWISLSTALAFLLLSRLHLAYLPSPHDVTQAHFAPLLSPMPRILFASLTSFALIQLLDLALFAYLRKQLNAKYLTLRTTLCLFVSQAFDTVLFSMLGLFGMVENIGHIILFSLVVKWIVILFSAPFIRLSKRMVYGF